MTIRRPVANWIPRPHRTAKLEQAAALATSGSTTAAADTPAGTTAGGTGRAGCAWLRSASAASPEPEIHSWVHIRVFF
jgi:hypothetical protein